jgi:hypothetical protein
MFEATEVHNHSSDYGGYRWWVEAALMTDAPLDVILEQFPAFRGGVKVLELYKKIFFDVEGYLDRKICVHAQVLAPSLFRSEAPGVGIDYCLKAFAYQKGFDGLLKMADLLNYGTVDDELSKWLQQVQNHRTYLAAYSIARNINSLQQQQKMAIVETASRFGVLESQTMDARSSFGELDDLAAQMTSTMSALVADHKLSVSMVNTTDRVEQQLGLDYNKMDETV